MARGPSTFKQTDVTRALKGALAAGMKVSRVEIAKDGRIIVEAGEADARNDADRALAQWLAGASNGAR